MGDILKLCSLITPQPAFTGSKLTTETIEQGVKYVRKINNKDTRTNPIIVFLLLTFIMKMLAVYFFHHIIFDPPKLRCF